MLEDDIEILVNHFKGSRLADFLESVTVLRESVGQGGWVKRGRQRVTKGFGKGIATKKTLNEPPLSRDNKKLFRLYMAAKYGSDLNQDELVGISDDELAALAPKLPVDVFRAWLRMIVYKTSVCTDLDLSRPQPVYTEIGLSRRVTATLQDIGLNLDLSTRRVCPLKWRWENETDKSGKIIKVKKYFPDWPEGTKFGTGRFSYRDCEACGKSIPSRLVVPTLINDESGEVHGFWFGRDCARNIFGIKDVGMNGPAHGRAQGKA